MTDWTDWRSEFPILQRKTYLNSCSLGALSHRAVGRIGRFHEQWHEYGAAAWYELWMAAIGELRGRVGRMLGATDEEIALVASTSAGLATVASAIDYGERPRVVISELDFPTLGYQWMVRGDVEVVRVRSDDGATIDPARFAEAVDDRTAVLATSHVFFTTGAIQNLRTLADIAHRNGALFLVDAYQSVGQVPVDVRDIDADVFLTGPLKWLLGGPGLAYLYVKRERIASLRPKVTGWFAAKDQFAFDITRHEFREDAARFELGTPALPTVHAALGGQEIIDEIGVAAIRERNLALTERLIDGATTAGYRVRCAPSSEQRSAIVMIEHPDPHSAVARLADNDVIVDARPGYVRISPHFYNTEGEVDQAIHIMAARS